MNHNHKDGNDVVTYDSYHICSGVHKSGGEISGTNSSDDTSANNIDNNGMDEDGTSFS